MMSEIKNEIWDYDAELRICDNTCSHYDGINQCCWIVSERGLCSDRTAGDSCLYGFFDDDGN